MPAALLFHLKTVILQLFLRVSVYFTNEPQSVKTSLNDEVLKFYLLTYI